jgi:ABC-type amino acid transport substrate-binding protein
VQFCIPYSSIDIVLMAQAERKIVAAADLASLRVGVARASTPGYRDQRGGAAGHAHHALRR